MKINFISKLINYGLWQGADSSYFELNPQGLEVDYHEASADDLLLPKQASDKFITELNYLSNGQKLESGASLYFNIKTPINTRKVSLTSIAGENHKYLLKVLEPKSTAWKLSHLGIDSDILRSVKLHLKNKESQGLIVVSSSDLNTAKKTITALANELEILNREIISLGKIKNSILHLNKEDIFLKNIDEHDLISLLNKHSEDVIINNIDNEKIIKALIKYSLNSDKLIILGINSQSSNHAYSKLQNKINDKGLIKKIDFILHQESLKRLCPHCLGKEEHSIYEARDLDKLSFYYDLGDLKNNSYTSSGCQKCNYKANKGEVLASELSSLKHSHLNTPSLIDDAFQKQKLGIISSNDLLRISRI